MSPLPARLLIAAALAGFICVSVALLANWVPYGDLDAWTYDFLVNHGRYARPSPDVVFVDFDDDTFARIQQYPVSRSTIAQVIRKIAQAKPSVVGLDIFLSEPRAAGEDREMQAALTEAANVVLAAQAPVGQLPGVRPLPGFCEPEEPSFPTGYCVEGKAGALGYAAVNMTIDDDGFIRQMELKFDGEKSSEPSFAVFLAMIHLSQIHPNCADCVLRPVDGWHATFGGHRIPYADPIEKTALLGHWSPNPVTRFSAWEALAGSIPENALADKIVLIGQSSDAARDQHFTPIFRVAQADGKRKQIPGTALQAIAIQTLLDGAAIATTPFWVLWSVNFAIVAAAEYLVMMLSLRGAFISNFLFLSGSYLSAQYLFTAHSIWFPYLTTMIATAATMPLGLAYQYVSEQVLHSKSEAQRAELMGIFSKYVDPEVAQTIWIRRNEVSLSGQEKVATILFTDIRGFTQMTAGMPSQIVLRWLNNYFTEMDNIIRAHGGLLNKFLGDGLLVVYGVPLSRGLKEDTCEAVRTAFAMLRRIEELNLARDPESPFPRLRIGVGIHTGPITCGNVGSAKRLEYSVIGETVNLASRLESLNKNFDTEIILSGETYEIVKDVFPNLYALGSVPVRGFEEPLLIYSANTEASTSEGEALLKTEDRGAAV